MSNVQEIKVKAIICIEPCAHFSPFPLYFNFSDKGTVQLQRSFQATVIFINCPVNMQPTTYITNPPRPPNILFRLLRHKKLQNGEVVRKYTRLLLKPSLCVLLSGEGCSCWAESHSSQSTRSIEGSEGLHRPGASEGLLLHRYVEKIIHCQQSAVVNLFFFFIALTSTSLVEGRILFCVLVLNHTRPQALPGLQHSENRQTK